MIEFLKQNLLAGTFVDFLKENALIIGIVAGALLALTIILIAVSKAKKKKAQQRYEEAKRELKQKYAKEREEKEKAQAEMTKKRAEEERLLQEQAESKQEKTEEVKEEPVPEVKEEIKEEVKAEPVKEEKVEGTQVEEVKEEPVKEEVVKEEVKEEKKQPVKEKKVTTKEESETVKATEKKKPVAEKKATVEKKKPAEKATKPAKKFVGKWIIEKKSDDEFMSKLAASNNEVMLSSEIYSSEEGARNGIATIIKNILGNGEFVIYQDKKNNYYYKLKTSTNKLLCVGEIYKTKDQCLKAVESVKRIAADSIIQDEVVMGEYVEYQPLKVEKYEVKKGAYGKWKIEMTEEGKYSAKLYASNGQLMLSTEEVAGKATAESNIESVKKNSAEGNFIIDRDKFGRFYYKLRNAKKSVICISESYQTFDSCTSALESVRKLAATATMVE